MKSHELFQQMSPALAGEIFAYLQEEQKPVLKAAIQNLAAQRKLRAVFVERKPPNERFAWLKNALGSKISDVLAVESQLSDVQGQIEQLSTQQAHLKDSASLATLSVLFALPPTPETIQTSRGWDPGAQLDQASSALLGIGQGLASAGIWLVVVGLPVGLAILIVLGLAFFLARRIRRSGPPAQVIVPPTEG